jgi:hypothetical protein
MNETSAKSSERLNAYRRFASETAFTACRLVHYDVDAILKQAGLANGAFLQADPVPKSNVAAL